MDENKKWYEVTITTTFLVHTADIMGTSRDYEVPTFPDLDQDTEVIYEGGISHYSDPVFICNCGEDCGCDTQVNTEGQDCDECFSEHSPPIEEEEEVEK